MDSDNLIKAACSFIVPGLGQMIKGDFGRGLKFLIGFIVIWFALLFTQIPFLQTIVGIILRIFSAYDAYNLNEN